MRVLLIHNRYKQSGGEDAVFRSEGDLLLKHGHVVGHMIYNNAVIKTFFDKLMSGVRTVYNPISARALQLKIQEFQPDIIHVHNFLPLVSPSVFFTAQKFNIPVVLTLHNYRLICPSATLFNHGRIYEEGIHSVFPWDAIRRGVYRNSRVQTAAVVVMTAVHHFIGTWRKRVDGYIALTQFAKDKFESSALAIPSRKMFIKPNFVEDPGENDSVREDFFLFIGRLTEEKGIVTLLEAARIGNFKLVVIGDGPLRETVERYAEQNPQVRILGFQPGAAVVDYLKKCRALIFPSIWYEGFPVTLLEAFATGTPVIASGLGAMKEIIQDRINGLYFEPGNECDLLFKISEIIENKDLAQSMADQARLSYLRYYTPLKNYHRLMEIYTEVIQQREMMSYRANEFSILADETVA